MYAMATAKLVVSMVMESSSLIAHGNYLQHIDLRRLSVISQSVNQLWCNMKYHVFRTKIIPDGPCPNVPELLLKVKK